MGAGARAGSLVWDKRGLRVGRGAGLAVGRAGTGPGPGERLGLVQRHLESLVCQQGGEGG